MDIVIIIYLVILGTGIAGGTIKAVMYWRGRSENAKKLAALMVAKAILDIVAIGLIIWLWYGNIASSWTIVMTVLPVMGAVIFLTMLYESKLAKGKLSLDILNSGSKR